METVRIEPPDNLRCHVFGFANISHGFTACIGYSLCRSSDPLLFQVRNMNFRKRLAAVARAFESDKRATIDRFVGITNKGPT